MNLSCFGVECEYCVSYDLKDNENFLESYSKNYKNWIVTTYLIILIIQ